MRLMAAVALALVMLCAGASTPHAQPAPDRLALLRRGINITHWFRYPPRADAAALRSYLTDTDITALRAAGFTFVRLAVQPEFLAASPQRLALLVEAITRLERAGLAVVVGPHPTTWHLEDSAADRARLRAFWRDTAGALRPLDPRRIFPELLNEPVFANDPRGWGDLQTAVLTDLRARLPESTIVLTGAAWGGIDGLATLHPATDRNVIYSVHFYEPAELTALASYRPGLDRAALAGLPFPMNSQTCAPVFIGTRDEATRALMSFTCGMAWNADRVGERIGVAAAWGTAHHAAVLLGEFGATQALNPAARLAWLTAVRGASEQRGIGWALWGYDDQMGFGIDPRSASRTLDRATLTALGLPRQNAQ